MFLAQLLVRLEAWSQLGIVEIRLRREEIGLQPLDRSIELYSVSMHVYMYVGLSL